MNTHNREFLAKRAVLRRGMQSRGEYHNRLFEAAAGQQHISAEDTQFWTGDWRLGIAEERVAMAEERLARAQAQLATDVQQDLRRTH